MRIKTMVKSSKLKTMIPLVLLLSAMPAIARQKIDPKILGYAKEKLEKQNLFNVDFDLSNNDFLVTTWSDKFDSLESTGASTSQQAETASKIMGIFNGLGITDINTQEELMFQYLKDHASHPGNVVKDSLFKEIREGTHIGWGYNPKCNEGFIPTLIGPKGHVQIFNYDITDHPQKIQFRVPYEDVFDAYRAGRGLFLPVRLTGGINSSKEIEKEQGVLGFEFRLFEHLDAGFEFGYPLDKRTETNTSQTPLQEKDPYWSREIVSDFLEERKYDAGLNLVFRYKGLGLGVGGGLSRDDINTSSMKRIPLLYGNGSPVLDEDGNPIEGTKNLGTKSSIVYRGKGQGIFSLDYNRLGLDVVAGVRGKSLEPYVGARASFRLTPNNRKTVRKTVNRRRGVTGSGAI